MAGARAPGRPTAGVRQRGAATLVAALVLLAVCAIGTLALWLANSNIRSSSNIYLRERARYAAEAGVAHARRVLAVVDWDLALAGGHPGDDVPSVERPQGIGALLANGATLLSDVPMPVAGGPDTVRPTYTVWVRNDPVEVAAGRAIDDGDNQILVRAEGRAAEARVIVEAAVARGLPAPATPFDHAGRNLDAGNSNVVRSALRLR